MADEAAATENLTQAVPFFFVRDMPASLRFYIDGLGFQMTNQWVVEDEVRWCWLQRGGAGVMLQQYTAEAQARLRPEGKAREGFSICFLCEDALALYREFKEKGLDPSRPFVGNGLWVTSLSDPDGFRLEFESPADASEETEYSDDGTVIPSVT